MQQDVISEVINEVIRGKLTELTECDNDFG